MYQLTTESCKKHFYGHSLPVLHFTCLLAYLLKAASPVRALTLDHHLGRGARERKKKNGLNGVYFSILIMSSLLLSLAASFSSFSSVYLQFHHLLLPCQDITHTQLRVASLFCLLHGCTLQYRFKHSLRKTQ